MKTSNFVLVGLVAALATFIALPSCTGPQLQRADRIFADVNTAGTIARDVAKAPALPSPVRTGAELLGLAALGMFGLWEKIRASKILEKSEEKSVALNAIADGVDQAPPTAAADVKASIKGVMMAREILSTANAVIDAHRSKLTS